MFIDTLALELTRRCKLNCAHCLRGPSQKLDMPDEVIYDLFGQGFEIGCLLLTGGEPTLNPKAMDTIGSGLCMSSTTARYVGMTTNGLSFTKRPQEALEYIHRFTTDPYGDDMSYITVSRDKYHMSEHGDPIRENLEEHPLYKGEHGEQNDPLVLGSMAELYGLDDADEHIPNINKFKSGACLSCPGVGTQGGVSTLAVTAKGNVVLSVNMSYAQEDNPDNILCHVRDLRETLEDIHGRSEAGKWVVDSNGADVFTPGVAACLQTA